MGPSAPTATASADNQNRRRAGASWRTVLAVSTPLILAACGEVFFSPEAPPLAGERISILSLQQALEPDPQIADLEVRLPRPWENPEWPQAGGLPDHAMHHLAFGDAPRRIWRASMGTGSNDVRRLLASPVVAGEKVFALDAVGQVAAVSADDGTRLWRRDIVPEDEDPGALGGGIAYDGGMLFVGSGYGEVIALDATTGNELWRRRIGIPLRGAPTIRDGRLFVISYDNQLHALSREDGSVLWTYLGIAETAALLGAASAAAGGELVVAPFSSGELVALRADNGRVVWSDSLVRTGQLTSLSELSDINGRPIIDRGVVYAISHAGRMIATDLRTGARLWTQNISGTESPWVAGDFIYLITSDSELVALSRRDGRVRWVSELQSFRDPKKRTGPITWTGPVLASDRLILTSSSGQAIAVSPYTGKLLGTLDLPDGVFVGPVLAGGTLFILTDDAELVAYR